MRKDDIIKYCRNNLDGVIFTEAWGERGVFYNPNNRLKRGVYVLTIKEKDGKNDHASLLNRENVYRINVGLRKATFIKHFGSIPKRPDAGQIISMDFDFTALDTIMPHPIYAWMGWVCVLNPTPKTFAEFQPMVIESYNYAIEKFSKKKT